MLARTGQTEAAVDLARLAGLIPAGVICEIMNEDGTMARVPDLVKYCERHNLKMITVADVIRYRRRTEKLVRQVAVVRMPTRYGDFTAYGYESLLDGEQHLAVVKGEVAGKENVLVRVPSECLTGDVFHSLRCDCGDQLKAALDAIEAEGRGSSSTWPRRVGASACLTSCVPMSSKNRAGTPWRPMWSWALPRPPRLRYRCSDSERPGALFHPDHDQQPEETRGAGRVRSHHNGAGAVGSGAHRQECALSPNEEEKMGHILHHQGLQFGDGKDGEHD